ncbi:MAG TPA: hypothetical protein VFT27_11610 [Actinomycetota bacterium]|nr:hypothetical protein [Actinomycetota bacterium]
MEARIGVPSTGRALLATALVGGAIAAVVLGGYAIGGVLTGAAGPPVDVAGVVRVQPLSGWELAARFDDPPRVRLTRGSGNLDVVAVPFEDSAGELVRRYVREVLEPEARQLSISSEVEQVTLESGLPGVRIAYVGLFGKAQAPIEGEVTAVVSASGDGAVFDAWGSEGVLRYVVDDVRRMIDRAVIT